MPFVGARGEAPRFCQSLEVMGTHILPNTNYQKTGNSSNKSTSAVHQYLYISQYITCVGPYNIYRGVIKIVMFIYIGVYLDSVNTQMGGSQILPIIGRRGGFPDFVDENRKASTLQ